MFGEIQFELSSLHTLLLFLIIGGSIAILFLEIRKIKIQINSLSKDNKSIADTQNPINSVIPMDTVIKESTSNIFPTNNSINKDSFSNIKETNNIYKNKNTPTDNIPTKNNLREIPLKEISEDINIDNLMNNDDESEYEINSDNKLNEVNEVNDYDEVNNIVNSIDFSSDSDKSESDDEDNDSSDSDDLDHSDDDSEKMIEEYRKLTVNELKSILSEKNLPVTGNKTKLIQRIKENM